MGPASEPVGSPEHYEIEESHQRIIAAARLMLCKVLASRLPDIAERATIADLFRVLGCLPAPSKPLDIDVTLVAPRRYYGEAEIYHFWSIRVREQDIDIVASGHFYRKSTGGDSFTSMMFSASPGSPSDLEDWSDQYPIVVDLRPFPQQIAALDLDEGGYTLTVERDGDSVGAREAEEGDADGEERPHEVEEGQDEAAADKTAPIDIAEAVLARLVASAPYKGEPILCAPPPTECDECGRPTDDLLYIVDGALRDEELKWSFMCAACFATRGIGLGMGRGQAYRRQEDGDWALVAGAPSEHQSDQEG